MYLSLALPGSLAFSQPEQYKMHDNGLLGITNIKTSEDYDECWRRMSRSLIFIRNPNINSQVLRS